MMSEQDRRFWSKVDKSGGTESCWPWMAYINKRGYGGVYFNKKQCKAHRVAYELIKGHIPDGLTLDHLCRRRECVNPLHLEAVTMRVNVLRSPIGVTAINARKTHCIHGHPFSGSNLHLTSTRKERVCKQCKRESETRRPNRERR